MSRKLRLHSPDVVGLGDVLSVALDFSEVLGVGLDFSEEEEVEAILSGDLSFDLFFSLLSGDLS